MGSIRQLTDEFWLYPHSLLPPRFQNITPISLILALNWLQSFSSLYQIVHFWKCFNLHFLLNSQTVIFLLHHWLLAHTYLSHPLLLHDTFYLSDNPLKKLRENNFICLKIKLEIWLKTVVCMSSSLMIP